ncbi:MAG: lipopolysaccharide biosynthesis protein [Candidatus Omnitrophica bacterium]|nr:lipopolysaccharide biosynthesis protein [Candidatus Omnitrophota bacterium]
MDSIDSPNTENVLTFRDYVQVLFRQQAVIAVSIITVLATAFIGLKLQTKMYESTVKMLISAQKQVESPYYKEAYGMRETEPTLTQSEIVKSDPIIMRVVTAQSLQRRPLDDEKQFASPLRAKAIELDTKMFVAKLKSVPPAQQEALLYRRAKEMLKASIKVEPIRDTNMFTITVRDYNPIGAAILANTVSRSYVIFDLEQQLAELKMKYGEKHPKVMYLKDNIAKMQKSLDGQPLEDIEAIGPASVKIIEQASVPLEPTGMRKQVTFMLAFVMSIFLGVMLAFVFEYADQSLKTPRDIEQVLGLSCLGSIRRRRFWQKPLVNFAAKPTAYSHSIQSLCDHLYLVLKEKGIASLMIVATMKLEDALTVVVNMAAYISGSLKHRVLVVDADFRVPAVHKVYKVKNDNGLADYLEGKVAFKDLVKPVTDNLAVVAAGDTELNPIILLDSDKMDVFMKEAKASYDFVLVRSSAMRNHRDPSVLIKHIDALLVIVDAGKVRRLVAQKAFEPLQNKARHNLGALLVNRTFPIPKWIYDRI